MSSRKTFIQKVLNELPLLKSQQLIDESSLQRLNEHYRRELDACPSSSRYLTLALVIGGIFMIAAGLSLLIAHNWDMLAKTLRMFIAAIPLFLGAALGIYTIVRNKDTRWREASAILTAAGIICLSALISQIYHIQGELRDFMMLVMAITLPLLYIFNSFGYAAFYCLSIGFLFKDFQLPPIALLYVTGVLPFLLYHMFRDIKSYQATGVRYMTIPLLLYLVMMKNPQLQLIGLGSLLYLCGLEFRRRNIPLRCNPWLYSGWIMLTVLLLIGSSTNYFWQDFFRDGHETRSWIVLLPLYLVNILLVADGIMRKRRDVVLRVVVALSVLFIPGMIFMSDAVDLLRWLTNLYLLVFGAVLIFSSIKSRELLAFNAGMLQISILLLIRFFDSNIDMLIRAAAFIILGLGFIGANIYVGKKFRNERRESHE